MDTVLLAHIEMLESENSKIRECTKKSIFVLKTFKMMISLYHFIQDLFHTCTWYIFSAFFEFLGLVVHHLNYWGSKEKIHIRIYILIIVKFLAKY